MTTTVPCGPMPRAKTVVVSSETKEVDNLLPKEKIALALKNHGVQVEAANGGIDDVAREKIKKLTKYFNDLSHMYQRSLSEFHHGTHLAHGHDGDHKSESRKPKDGRPSMARPLTDASRSTQSTTRQSTRPTSAKT